MKIKKKAIKNDPTNIAKGVMLPVRIVIPAETLPLAIVDIKLFLNQYKVTHRCLC